MLFRRLVEFFPILCDLGVHCRYLLGMFVLRVYWEKELQEDRRRDQMRQCAVCQ